MTVYTQDAAGNQAAHPPDGHDPELTLEAKALMLSAHLNLVHKKLRRGIPVEQREILQLLPFTVSDGWRPEVRQSPEPFEEVPVLSVEDQDWQGRVMEASSLP